MKHKYEVIVQITEWHRVPVSATSPNMAKKKVERMIEAGRCPYDPDEDPKEEIVNLFDLGEEKGEGK